MAGMFLYLATQTSTRKQLSRTKDYIPDAYLVVLERFKDFYRSITLFTTYDQSITTLPTLWKFTWGPKYDRNGLY